MAVQDYSGAAEELSLQSGIDGSVTAFTVAETPSANWPTGGNGFFVLVIDPGVAGKEEKVKVTARSGSDFTIERGYDDTSGATHATGAKIRHSIDSLSFARANKAVVNTIEQVSTAAQILISTASETLDGVTVSGDATLASNGALTIAAGAVNASKVAADVATQAELDAHASDTSSVHGITDTTVLATDTEVATAVSDHSADTTSVHGITDTSDLVVTGDLSDLAADLADVPRGVLGYAEVTANQTGIGTSDTDLTGLAVTITAGTDRRLRITGHIGVTVAGVVTTLRIAESTTQIQARGYGGGGSGAGVTAEAIITPSAGEHTYKLTLRVATSTVDLVASATQPSFILVEDIGSSA